MDETKPRGWIATDPDETAIHGIGVTSARAAADASREARAPDAQWTTYRATDALIDQVKREGGAISWDYRIGYGGVRECACTLEEAGH